jgi:hypothetical protein
LIVYLLDTNVFIQAKNLHYGLDFCPAFWEWLIEKNTSKQVFSVEKVGDEIDKGKDELAAWAALRGPGFFIKPDAAVPPLLDESVLGLRVSNMNPPLLVPFFKVLTTILWRTPWLTDIPS